MCQLCEKRVATDLHHIYNKEWTRHNPVARKLTNVLPLVTVLCNPCNITNADMDPHFWLLWDKNVHLYGFDVCTAAYDKVVEATTVGRERRRNKNDH